jgi:uncharacterized flavoprotein (TIGR03862 family)
MTASNAAVVGAGPAGLMAAEVLADAGVAVTVYDRMPSAGRKFLLAGRGGLNLTHSENTEQLMSRYGDATPRLRAALAAFSPAALRAWSDALGQPTFVGSSGRVFPQAFKASPLLRAWLVRLQSAGVRFAFRHRWDGWNATGALAFQTPEGERAAVSKVTILALGGASWPRMGSDGAWVGPIAQAGVAIAPLRPANVGVLVAWSQMFRDRFEGQPLKSIAVSCGGDVARGDAIVTAVGLEGGAIYGLSSLRAALDRSDTVIHVALRPDMTAAALAQKLATPRGKQSMSTFLRKALNLSPVAIGFLHEASIESGLRVADMTPPVLAQFINAIPLRITCLAPTGRAISTAGGILFAEVDETFMLTRKPGVFVAGEMLDWEAPTGGYLLQASFATGAAAGRGALAWLKRE